MTGRFQIQGDKNWFFPKEMNANRFFMGLLMAENLVKPLFSLHGTEWRERGYGLWILDGKNKLTLPPVRIEDWESAYRNLVVVVNVHMGGQLLNFKYKR
jgi:hypothetical protein